MLIALKAKGETVDEIAGAALAMRAVSSKVVVQAQHLVDTCGTGGSGAAKRFNISTAAAFVAAAAGAPWPKHGNRGMSQQERQRRRVGSGRRQSRPVAGAGGDVASTRWAWVSCSRRATIPPCATPVRCGANWASARVFNLLGPLTNPASAKRQVLGVFGAEWQQPLALACHIMGSEHVLVVHSAGLDELSIAGPSQVVEMSRGVVDVYEISPADFGLQERDMNDLRAETPAQSLALLRAALNGSNEAASDVVALNARRGHLRVRRLHVVGAWRDAGAGCHRHRPS